METCGGVGFELLIKQNRHLKDTTLGSQTKELAGTIKCLQIIMGVDPKSKEMAKKLSGLADKYITLLIGQSTAAERNESVSVLAFLQRFSPTLDSTCVHHDDSLPHMMILSHTLQTSLAYWSHNDKIK